MFIQRARLVAGAGAGDEYDRLHRPENVHPGLAEAVRRAGFTRYLIARDDVDLFSAVEVDDPARAAGVLAESAAASEWLRRLAPLMDVPDHRRPWRPLPLVYDLGWWR